MSPDGGSDKSSFLSFLCFFFLSCFSFFDLLELLLFDKLYFFDESDNDGSEFGSPGKYVGSVDESVGSVSGVGSGDFVTTGIESLGEVVLLVVFVPRRVDSKVG